MIKETKFQFQALKQLLYSEEENLLTFIEIPSKRFVILNQLKKPEDIHSGDVQIKEYKKS
jgi:hypothetical protein